ncbi:LOW QUALITY PROTEIN: biliverdin reductase A [Electrophorus electricus]|uniref:LOW QUALITY PROTEIN: biliverdin reductase A n=1 Tax=Electrophorus electricus TaxID=8005 RepID=UPI0015D05859|nr:LOW QUALITY PROTEIN: biliverdin reductase A [Electrophorus electricus]
MFGAVVVGIGMAGNARIQDMLAPLPSSVAEKFSIKGFVCRRTLGDKQGVPQIPLEEALCRSDIQVAFVCTENASHEEHIRRFLEEGMHVSVEYPMTLSYTAAVDLCDLAQQKGLVLHEEHIELFTPDFKQLKKDIAGKKLEEGSLHFTGGLLKPGFGFPSFSGIARLTWLVELFGELTLKAATTVEDEDKKHMKMTAHFLTKDQKPLTWVEERGEGLGRAKRVHLRFDSCTVTELPAGQREPVGLFMQDLVLFGRKLQGDVPPEELQAERVRILHCLRLADGIRQLCHR